MSTSYYVSLFIDALPFVLYIGLLGKILSSWLSPRCVDQKSRSPLAAVLLLTCVVIVLFILSNIYTLVTFGRSFFSIRVFQMFVVGNCVVYWLLIELLVRNIRRQVAQEATSESAK